MGSLSIGDRPIPTKQQLDRPIYQSRFQAKGGTHLHRHQRVVFNECFDDPERVPQERKVSGFGGCVEDPVDDRPTPQRLPPLVDDRVDPVDSGQQAIGIFDITGAHGARAYALVAAVAQRLRASGYAPGPVNIPRCQRRGVAIMARG